MNEREKEEALKALHVSTLREASHKAGGKEDILLEPGREEALKTEVETALALDIRLRKSLEPYLKTAKTLSHSLGDVAAYLDDARICSACTSYYDCPKRQKGYALKPSYVPNADRVRFHYLPCPKDEEERLLLARIAPRMALDKEFLEAGVKLPKTLFAAASGRYPDTTKLFASFYRALKEKKDGRKVPFLSFYSVNSRSFSRQVLLSFSYLLAKSGQKGMYLKAEDFLLALRHRNPDVRSSALSTWNAFSGCDFLAFEGFSSLPRLGTSFYADFLPSLFHTAREKNLFLLFEEDSPEGTLSAIRYALYGTSAQDEVLNAFEERDRDFVLKDLPE